MTQILNRLELEIKSSGLLMSHLDAAFHRVEYIKVGSIKTDVVDKAYIRNLSNREHEILHWVTSGKTNLEIGMILEISPNTVKNHLKKIFHKLEVTCRAQAAAKYVSMDKS